MSETSAVAASASPTASVTYLTRLVNEVAKTGDYVTLPLILPRDPSFPDSTNKIKSNRIDPVRAGFAR
ncbi:hypothetical protein N9B24_02485 [bacterium]|nr:hypothetical protein [Rubripirellula sp.]MDA7864972.1 hypothetical protein [bacterium]MDB4621284.1 hypothetical protein [Rubripirellula sp.]MDB4644727.1 hypothetical protein [Rubripirellula sp.]